MDLRILIRLVAIAAAVTGGMNAHAQAPSAGTVAWPSKPVHWIVPFAPGGPTDVVARVVGAKLAERIGQPVIIENRAGAGGNIGADAVIKAAPDGHTLLFVIPSILTNPFFFKSSPSFTELASVIQLTRVSLVLIAHPSFAPKSVAEIIAQIKARPGTVSCGSSGALPSVGCALLQSHAQADLILVPYKGNGPALNALMGGEINLLFDVVNTASVQIKAGRARAVATTNLRRGGVFADLPTVAETIADFDLISWQGVMAPRNTPGDIVLRINREIRTVLDLPEVRQRLIDMGLEVAGSSVDAFDELLRRDSARFGRVLQAAGVKAE